MKILDHNIAAMIQTKESPSFVQTLMTFQDAADRIKILESALQDIIDRPNLPEREQAESVKTIARVALGNIK